MCGDVLYDVGDILGACEVPYLEYLGFCITYSVASGS